MPCALAFWAGISRSSPRASAMAFDPILGLRVLPPPPTRHGLLYGSQVGVRGCALSSGPCPRDDDADPVGRAIRRAVPQVHGGQRDPVRLVVRRGIVGLPVLDAYVTPPVLNARFLRFPSDIV